MSLNLQYLSNVISNGVLLSFIGGIPLVAAFRKVNVFESFVAGAKDGFDISIKVIPYLIAFLVAIGMFRAAGGFTMLANFLGPTLKSLGFPVELLPLALIRPFSGSASNGVLVDIAHTYGGNSFIAHAAATMVGSTETTFYVVMVYFGAIGISRTRHAVPAGLIADFAGLVAAVVVTRWFYVGVF
jgi:spore maturation protein B